MAQHSDWQEVESAVYMPGQWVGLTVGFVFTAIGIGAFLGLVCRVQPDFPVWIAVTLIIAFTLFGIGILSVTIGQILRPVYVRHATVDSFPNLSSEPVIREGSVVQGRLTHELIEDVRGWELRPAERNKRFDRYFLLGFGVPFLLVAAGFLSWTFRHQFGIPNWPLAIVCGSAVTALCGGTPFFLIAMLSRSVYQLHSRLFIPPNEGDLELEFAVKSYLEQADLASALSSAISGKVTRDRRLISRNSVRAVQLCPWKFVCGTQSENTTWAVQGLLVLSDPANPDYERVPIVLTGDCVGASQLMERLAAALKVPYLFCADADGWKAENLRAKTRPTLKSGGTQT